MSTYTLYNQELEQILAEINLSKPAKPQHSSNKRRTISEEIRNFNYKSTDYNNVRVNENIFSISRDIKLVGSVDEEMLCLTFMNRGRSSFSCNSIKKGYMDNNTFNFFYINNENNSVTECAKNPTNDLLEIYITRDLFFELFDRYPAVFEKMYQKISKGQSFASFANGRFIGSQMQEVIEQITNSIFSTLP